MKNRPAHPKDSVASHFLTAGRRDKCGEKLQTPLATRKSGAYNPHPFALSLGENLALSRLWSPTIVVVLLGCSRGALSRAEAVRL